MAQHPGGHASTQVFHRPRAKMPMGKAEHAPAMHGLSPQVVAPCAPLAVLLWVGRGMWGEAEAPVLTLPPGLCWWGEWHPCPQGAAGSLWAALMLQESALTPSPPPRSSASRPGKERGSFDSRADRRALGVSYPLPDHFPLGATLAAAGVSGDKGTSPVAGWGGQSPHPAPLGLSVPGNPGHDLPSPKDDGGSLTHSLGVTLQDVGAHGRATMHPPLPPPGVPGHRCCPAVPLPAGRARPAGSPQEDGPGSLQQREGSCLTIQDNLSPLPLPSSRGDGYCLIPFDSSFIICLPPSSFPMAPPRFLCGRNQSLVSDGCSGGGREGTAE